MKAGKLGSAVITLTAILCVLATAPLWGKRQDKTDAKPAAAPAKPGAAEMERLKFYLGDWDYTESYEKTPFAPSGAKNTGVYTSKLGPGGNSLLNSFHSQGPVGDFEGLLVMTWNPKEKAYKSYIFGNSFPGAVVETGQFEADALVFRGEFSAGEMKMGLRNTTRLVGPEKLISEEYMSTNGGAETLLVRVEAIKRAPAKP
jgi:hypothetical protein